MIITDKPKKSAPKKINKIELWMNVKIKNKAEWTGLITVITKKLQKIIDKIKKKTKNFIGL